MNTPARAALIVLTMLATASALAAEPGWVARSNANAAPLLQVLAKYQPEFAASLGVEGFDAEVFDLKPDYDRRFQADLLAVAKDLESRVAAEPDPRVRQDLQILVGAARDQQATAEVNRRLMLPFVDLPQSLFQGFNSLLEPRVGKERYPAALARLRKYTGRAPGYEPITQLAQARARERFAESGPHRSLDGGTRTGAEEPAALPRRHPRPVRPERAQGLGEGPAHARVAAAVACRLGARRAAAACPHHQPPAARGLRRQPEVASASRSTHAS